MVAYSFHKQFVAPIIAGTKRQTIRRERHARLDEVMRLYTGMRTQHCRAIGEAICQLVCPITLDFGAERIRYPFGLGMVTLFTPDLDGFAQLEGFGDWATMRTFWAEQHDAVEVFSGVLIRWSDFRVAG